MEAERPDGTWSQVRPRGERAALSSNFSREAYLDAVERAIEYIAAGDVFQVNLSQRFTAALPEHPAQIYERLRAQSPACVRRVPRLSATSR